ncbi:malate synthase A [Polaribacter glomeratus]|uniref:Malate synthase n=1 Tax=Polaribacter glomeratus TaxID=102 RepID=A0A2S7WXP8_9FLAO|nr:malate synthase A [Polaribacter glomeratus]PQJ82369.1 malate synthase A [Polaribacter glomeratus]TXD64530.1 malate synthase A [Polaribacter glomeratus]
MEENTITKEISFNGFKVSDYQDVLTNEAQLFLLELHEKFNQRRLKLLEEREVEQAYFDAGNYPSFPKETKKIRESDWVCAPLPADLLDRRVEITGPVDRKMVINALNSGAKTFMADFEDSNSPNIHNNLQGQINLRDAINKTITYQDDKKNKTYQLNNNTATLIVRPRGLHLNEKHFAIAGEEMSGSLVDFGLYFFHNIKTLQAQNSATYFYLPKLEHYLEARLWNDIFVFAQDYLHIPQNTIKATVLVETITASFQLDEIIYELRNHMAGLNCGRWDYIFSYIKKFRNHANFMVPNRDQVTIKTPFMRAYSLLVIQRCHKRNVHAMGGMAAQIPIKNDEIANNNAFAKVYADKEQEVKNGHDGTWVAHPGLVSVAMNVFNENMLTKNQIHVKRSDVNVGVNDLVEMPKGTITEEGIRKNINVGILYIESWLRGNGAAAIYNLMEDAATAEISRTQVWLWLQKEVTIENGETFNTKVYEKFKHQEIEKIKEYVGQSGFDTGKFKEAIQLFDELVLTENFQEFLTLKAYDHI